MEQEKRIRREIANSNERRRMQSINAGFQSLRTLLPHHEGEKLSKVSRVWLYVWLLTRSRGGSSSSISNRGAILPPVVHDEEAFFKRCVYIVFACGLEFVDIETSRIWNTRILLRRFHYKISTQVLYFYIKTERSKILLISSFKLVSLNISMYLYRSSRNICRKILVYTLHDFGLRLIMRVLFCINCRTTLLSYEKSSVPIRECARAYLASYRNRLLVEMRICIHARRISTSLPYSS